MENNENKVLDEEQTEAVNGGVILPNVELHETDKPLEVGELGEASLSKPGLFEPAIGSPSELGSVNLDIASIISPASNSKKGFFGWLKNLFSNL